MLSTICLKSTTHFLDAITVHAITPRFHHGTEVGINICNFTINSMDPLFRALVAVERWGLRMTPPTNSKVSFNDIVHVVCRCVLCDGLSFLTILSQRFRNIHAKSKVHYTHTEVHFPALWTLPLSTALSCETWSSCKQRPTPRKWAQGHVPSHWVLGDLFLCLLASLCARRHLTQIRGVISEMVSVGPGGYMWPGLTWYIGTWENRETVSKDPFSKMPGWKLFAASCKYQIANLRSRLFEHVWKDSSQIHTIKGDWHDILRFYILYVFFDGSSLVFHIGLQRPFG